jgi:hypothetical protein
MMTPQEKRREGKSLPIKLQERATWEETGVEIPQVTDEIDWKGNCISTRTPLVGSVPFETPRVTRTISAREGPYPKVNSAAIDRSSGFDT